jgi:RNA polymerase sigma-70 factor (ECF subfamily)
LRELLDRQNEADRALLLLSLEGNSYREIAEVIGISESNVGTRLSRLKKSLREAAHASAK